MRADVIKMKLFRSKLFLFWEIKIMRTQLDLLARLTLSLLAGCPINNTVSTAQGVFVDAPVEGLAF